MRSGRWKATRTFELSALKKGGQPMADESLSPEVVAGISSTFEQLTIAAHHVNQVSNELGKWIWHLDHSLRDLNLGIIAWVPIVGNDEPDEHGDFWVRELGYAK